MLFLPKPERMEKIAQRAIIKYKRKQLKEVIWNIKYTAHKGGTKTEISLLTESEAMYCEDYLSKKGYKTYHRLTDCWFTLYVSWKE